MNGLNEFIKTFTKQYATCSCGEKCHLTIFICEHFVTISAKCKNCDKGMSLTENAKKVEYAKFYLMDDLVEEFKKRFNREVSE